MKRIILLAAAVLIFTSTGAHAQTYTGVDLYNLYTAPPGFVFPNVFSFDRPSFYYPGPSAGPGQPVGFVDSALLRRSPTGAATNFQPTNLSGFAGASLIGTNGSQQVGFAYTAGNFNHAMLWNNTAGSAVDLAPTNLAYITSSQALGTDGIHQVGYGRNSFDNTEYPLLWTGTGASAVDLTPAGYAAARALSVNGTHQVGGAITSFPGQLHAMVWSGTAASAVDLHPFGALTSTAFCASGTTQYGSVAFSTNSSFFPQYNNFHAFKWNGTADSAVDLNPDGFANSEIYATNGAIQVGYGVPIASNAFHALLWHNGDPASIIDLDVLLPTSLQNAGGGFHQSIAESIDAQGNIFGVAFDLDGYLHAVEWLAVSVPEPSTIVLAGFGVISILWVIRRRANKSVASVASAWNNPPRRRM